MERKYKLTKENISYFGKTLYRIEALKDFGIVKKGDKGGYVEKEDNLSQEGNCWIYDDAQVYDNARVCGYAIVFGSAVICDNAIVSGNAQVFGDTQVYDNAEVFGYAKVYGNAHIYDHTYVHDNAKVYGNAKVFGSAEIKNNSDYIVFKNWWSSGRYFTWTRSNNMWKVGCFYGTGEELITKAYEDSELSGREYKRIVDYVESIYKFLI